MYLEVITEDISDGGVIFGSETVESFVEPNEEGDDKIILPIPGASEEASGSERVEIENGPMQPKFNIYHPKMYDHLRDFQPSWFEKHVWLSYDTKSSTASCFPCRKLMESDFQFRNWKRSDKLKIHSESQTHLIAMLRWTDSKLAKSRNENILIQLKVSIRQRYERIENI